tara:strand:+ start:2011 stop:3981 length:1971 start_codon:yes stop_codon:yes gene_type:complete
MPQQIVIAEQLRIAALLNDDRVDELIVAQGRYQIGDVYLGTVENVLPGIDAAFVNIGESEKNGFIHVSDLGPLRLRKGAAGITELLEPRQKVLVQVMKEPTGNKGPRLTGNISLPGRYLVVQPNGQGVNIARKISSESERNRLKALGVLIKPPSSGLLMRTEAENISEELLIDDLENLLKQWEAIHQAGENHEPPVLLNRDDDFIHRILRDHINSNLDKIIVDNISAVEKINTFLSQDGNNISVEYYKDGINLLDHYRINSAITNALLPRVDLPSGGYIIIEPTEALTVIDVNSGSFTRSANARETVLWTNCEAAIEIARQLKLRNIGGVIIIDFIDMDSRRDQLQLLEHFTSAVKDDSSRPQIAQLTELGLVELTRKRQGQNIYELFGTCCEDCGGNGIKANLPSENILQASASAPGLARLSSIPKHEPQANSEINKKKKYGKSRQIESNSESTSNENDQNSIANSKENIDNSSYLASNPKNEIEIISVRMEPEQEEVFSLLGLNPCLLLDSPPAHDNFLVQIIRPGEDSEKITEELKNKMISVSNKRKRKLRGNSSKTSIKSSAEEDSISIDNENAVNKNEDEDQVEIDKNSNSDNYVIVNNESTKYDESILTAINIDTTVQEEILPETSERDEEENIEVDDSRRRRRRSSASI